MEIDPATVQMEFSVNNGPLAGRDGKKVTSRQIRERLERETQSNISISLKTPMTALASSQRSRSDANSRPR